MGVGDVIGWMVLVLLALYGCAQVIRRLCLWVFRCPQCALCCRLAVPQENAALTPLARCLQSQTVWDDVSDCCYTLMLLPESAEESPYELECIFTECPSVIPVSPDGLIELLQQLTRSGNRDGSGKDNCIRTAERHG